MSVIWNFFKNIKQKVSVSIKKAWSYCTYRNFIENIYIPYLSMDGPVPTKNITDQTCQTDRKNLDDLIKATKLFEVEYQKGIENRKNYDKIDSNDKLVEYQTKFWEAHVKCITDCNNTFIEIQRNAVDTACECCKRIWKFCCMVNLYNQIILGNWLETDLESRKLSILLAICDIERYRCKEPNSNIKEESDTDDPSTDEPGPDDPDANDPIEYDSDDRISVDELINDETAGDKSLKDDSSNSIDNKTPSASSTPIKNSTSKKLSDTI